MVLSYIYYMHRIANIDPIKNDANPLDHNNVKINIEHTELI